MSSRPSGQPLMHQNWGKLLFMHWPVEAAILRPLIPSPLQLETFDGKAWIGIVPFTMWDIRAVPPYVPRIPFLNAMHELNVRTYVSFDGEPGVWFLSLDCNNAAAVFGARTSYFLPYFNASINLQQSDHVIDYNLTRKDHPVASFSSRWTIGNSIPKTTPGSLPFFLTERYCLYSRRKSYVYRSRIFHQQWQLKTASVEILSSTMIESHGLPSPLGEPLLHYAEEISVDIWRLKRLK